MCPADISFTAGEAQQLLAKLLAFRQFFGKKLLVSDLTYIGVLDSIFKFSWLDIVSSIVIIIS
jgi:hypothetical protein